MVINSTSCYLNSYSTTVTFKIPAYSSILNFFTEHDTLIMIYGTDTYSAEETSVNIQYQKGGPYLTNFTPLYDYEYFTSIKKDRQRLDTIVNGSNLNLNVITESEYFHIFVQQNLALSEIRDRKLNQII